MSPGNDYETSSGKFNQRTLELPHSVLNNSINPLTRMNDHEIIFPYGVNAMSTRQVTRMKKKTIWEFSFVQIPELYSK